MSAKIIVVLAFIAGLSSAENPEVTTNLPEYESSTVNLPDFTLPPHLQNSISLPPELKDSQALGEVQDKVVSTIKRKCEKFGGVDAYDKFSKAGHVLGECISKLVNNTVLMEQIELGKLNGSVDDVFKGYCDKTPQFESCIKDAIQTVRICLSPEEQEQINIVEVVAQKLATFICFKEGDRIALFISDGGLECIQKNQEGIKQCANDTLAVTNNISEDILENEFFSFDEEHCKQFASFKSCVVKSLENCDRPTTANIVESLYKYAKQSTPCRNYTVTQQEPSAASGLFVTTATIVTAIIAILLV